MLKYLRLDIYFNNDYQNAPYFIGSTLRGVFGHALKKVCCINPSFKCENCFAATTCAYYDFYETKNKAHKFRFDISLNSKKWDFSLLLLEDACDRLPYILSALNIACVNYEFMRNKLTLRAIFANGVLVYDGKEFNLTDTKAQILEPKKLSSSVNIDILTPLRLKSNGTFFKPDDITPLAILLSIDKRYKELKNIDAKSNIENLPIQKEVNLKFVDLERYSNRQKIKMGLGGFMGNLLYENISEECANILQIGEIIGVGKSVVFGLGKIKIGDIS